MVTYLYGIYEDLFGTDTMFIPSKDLQILYDYDDEYVTPVFRGIPYFHAIKSSLYFEEYYIYGAKFTVIVDISKFFVGYFPRMSSNFLNFQ